MYTVRSESDSLKCDPINGASSGPMGRIATEFRFSVSMRKRTVTDSAKRMELVLWYQSETLKSIVGCTYGALSHLDQASATHGKYGTRGVRWIWAVVLARCVTSPDLLGTECTPRTIKSAVLSSATLRMPSAGEANGWPNSTEHSA